MIRIAEEANLWLIKVSVMKSSYLSYIVGGPNFYVAATFRKNDGWLVRVACCREEDEVLSIPPNAHYFDEEKLRLPFRAKWVSYLLRKTLADCPGASYRVMSEVIHDYVNEYAITNNILQDARQHARKDIFGEAEDNVKYAYALRDSLVERGHDCELMFTSRREVLRQIRAVVVKEELDWREIANEPTLERGQPRLDYINEWLRKHELELTKSDSWVTVWYLHVWLSTKGRYSVRPYAGDCEGGRNSNVQSSQHYAVLVDKGTMATTIP